MKINDLFAEMIAEVTSHTDTALSVTSDNVCCVSVTVSGSPQSKHFHLLRGKCVSLHKACHVMDSSDLIGLFNNARVPYWSI